MTSYIYIRSHDSYQLDQVVKLGYTSNIPNRESVYRTHHYRPGCFIHVFEVSDGKKAEKKLKQILKKRGFHKKINDGGTEFFDIKILNHIQEMIQNETTFFIRECSDQEIDEFVRLSRFVTGSDETEDETEDELQNGIISVHYQPREYQEQIINQSVEYFQSNDKGILALICGVGKTLLSLWVSERLHANTILIGVPNTLLLNQWKEMIHEPYLLVSGNIKEDMIISFLETHRSKGILITTYSSSHKVRTAVQKTRFQFDMKILDEVHHLTTMNMLLEEHTKNYIEILKIPSRKQLSLTATLKQLEHPSPLIVSNDNIHYFGKVIVQKSLLWAIQNQIVCDYMIQTIIATEDQLDSYLSTFRITDEYDKRLFLSAFTSLKSISNGHSHHLLVYTNNTNNSKKLILYIRMLLEYYDFNLSDLYYSEYNSEMKIDIQTNILKQFKDMKYGLISCVYCLGEGWDFPILDGVVFAENMTSNIRIVQSVLRASRKNPKEPMKWMKIILPILDCDDWFQSQDFKKVKDIVYYMGIEDETIQQKMRVYRMDSIPEKGLKKKIEREDVYKDEFGIYDEKMTETLKLKTIQRIHLDITYEKAKKIIAENRVISKTEYYQLCERDNRLSKNPEITFKGQFTNWIEYLNIPRIYYNLETCKTKVNEYVNIPDLKCILYDVSAVCEYLHRLDHRFPPSELWSEYYPTTDLREIIPVSPKKKKNIILRM